MWEANLVCNATKKMLKAIIKNGMTYWAEVKHSNMGLHKILVDLLLSLTFAEMEGCKLEQLKIKGHEPTEGKPRVEIDLNYWP
jgi:hypothetical protein